MPASKKVIVSIPQDLLQEMDRLSAVECRNRSQIIRDAIRAYLDGRRILALKERMQKGYEEMGDINKALAEEGLGTEAKESKG